MQTIFVSKEYVAIALIKAKYKFFREDFITFSELNQFNQYIQQEFNKQNVDAVITFNSLSREDFNTMGEIVMLSDECVFDLCSLPLHILRILNDTDLIAKFFMDLESERLKVLENKQEEVLKRIKDKNNTK